MAYRSQPQYRSWNALALGLRTEESVEIPDKIEDLWSKDRQRPRRESWSQPPQRGRGTRGRGVWFIDNRPHTLRRRYTMPNSREDCQDYNYRTDDESSDINQGEDNQILEEPSRNLTSSPEGGSYDIKTNDDDREKWDNKNQDEHPRKPYSDNIYRPPKSRSTSYIKEPWKANSSSDDGSQSQGYSNSHSNGSKKYELENYKVQRNNNAWEKESTNSKPDQAWVHDKFGSLESESESDSKGKKDASIHVSPFDLNDKPLTTNNTNEITEFSKKKIDEPDSPKDQIKKPLIINSELPKEITIKFSELTLKESIEETIISQTLVQENEQLLLIDPGVTEATSEVVPEVTPEVTPIAPKDGELPMLINLDEEDNDGTQPIVPRISEDILTLDWESYQKDLIEEELKLTMKRQVTQTPNQHKLDTGLKDFDSLL